MAKCEPDHVNGGYLITGIEGFFDVRLQLQPEGKQWQATVAKGGSTPGYGSTKRKAVSDFLKRQDQDQRILDEALKAIDEGCPD